MPFQKPVNNFSSTLSAQHTSGSGTLALQSGDGAKLGSLAAYQVYRVTVFTVSGSTETIAGIFEATGLSTDTLTGVTAVEGYSDSTIASGAKVEVRPTAKTLSELQAAVTDLQLVTEVAVTGGVTLTASAVGRVHVCSGTSADYTVVLPDATDPAVSGKTISFRMAASLTRFVTLDGSGSQAIDGALTRVMWSGETATLYSDGSNWFKIGGRPKELACEIRLPQGGSAGPVQAIPNGAVTAVQFSQAYVDNSTRMADLANYRIVCKRAGTYRLTGCVPWDVVPSGGILRLLALPAVNGTTTTPSAEITAPTANGYPALSLTGLTTLAAGDTVDLRVYHSYGSAYSLFGDPAGGRPSLAMVEVSPW